MDVLPVERISEASQVRARSPDGRTAVAKAQHDASLLRLKAREAEKMASVDVDDVLQDITGGMTQTETARKHGVAASTLSTFLNSQTGDLAKRIASARKSAADALADRALHALDEADEEKSSSVQLAGLKAKHFQWRAATADRSRFAERPTPEQAQPGGQQIPSFTIQILGNNQQNQQLNIIQHDAGESLV